MLLVLYHTRPGLQSITQAFRRRCGAQAEGGSVLRFRRHPAVTAQRQQFLVLHCLRFFRRSDQPLCLQRLRQLCLSAQGHKLPVADAQPHKTPFPGAQQFHRRRGAAQLAAGIDRQTLCPDALLRGQGTGGFCVHAQICHQLHGAHAPPRQLVFHRTLGGAAAPEQYHCPVVLGNYHRRRLRAAHKVDMHHVPAERVAQPDAHRCRQQNARQSHPQTHPPAESQHPKPAQQQTDQRCVDGIKVNGCPGLCAEPDRPAVQ